LNLRIPVQDDLVLLEIGSRIVRRRVRLGEGGDWTKPPKAVPELGADSINCLFETNGPQLLRAEILDDRPCPPSASADDSVKLRLAVDDIDILSLLPKLTIPTIVFHCRRDHLVPFEQGRLLAASIPNAKFVPLDSENHVLLSHEPALARLIADTEIFLSES
jgi:pimeloyl-ACP methyl ester carboxylesterase